MTQLSLLDRNSFFVRVSDVDQKENVDITIRALEFGAYPHQLEGCTDLVV